MAASPDNPDDYVTNRSLEAKLDARFDAFEKKIDARFDAFQKRVLDSVRALLVEFEERIARSTRLIVHGEEVPVGKYAKLSEHLIGLAHQKSHVLTFAHIEEIIGDDLPASARTIRAWWSNTRSHTQGRAWLEYGWLVASVNLESERVRFNRRER